MNLQEAIAFATKDVASASDAYEATAHARAAVAAAPGDAQHALRHARAACAAALGPLRSVAAWDAATYWDAVPDGFQAAHAAVAVLWAALDAGSAGARLHVDVATICASSARGGGPARSVRLAALRAVRGAGGTGAHVAPWSHATDVIQQPSKRRKVEPRPVGSRPDTVEAHAFKAGPRPVRISKATVSKWTSVAELVQGFEDVHVPAERGQGEYRRQELVTLGALREGVARGDADAPYVAQHRLFDQVPALRAGLGATFLRLAPPTAVAVVWAGPGGTGTPLHFDPVDNVVGQFCGAKRWRLWRPQSGEPTGSADFDFVVAPGDALFVPRGWWHRVDALPCAGGAVSVSLWFADESELPAFSNR